MRICQEIIRVLIKAHEYFEKSSDNNIFLHFEFPTGPAGGQTYLRYVIRRIEYQSGYAFYELWEGTKQLEIDPDTVKWLISLMFPASPTDANDAKGEDDA